MAIVVVNEMIFPHFIILIRTLKFLTLKLLIPEIMNVKIVEAFIYLLSHAINYRIIAVNRCKFWENKLFKEVVNGGACESTTAER